MRYTDYLLKFLLGIALFFLVISCKTASAPGGPKHTSEARMEAEYLSSTRIRYHDFVYAENIQSVVLRKENALLTFPVIELGSAEKLELSFDDLERDLKYYRYTLIHCSFDWQPTADPQAFYLDGFTEDLISDSRYSMNTLQGFTHYRLLFPTENMKPRKSGNYLLMVWNDKFPGVPVITRRFYISDPSLRISALIKNATAIDERKYKQEVDFTINTSGRRIEDPYKNLSVAILQNGRWDNAITSLKPRMVNGDVLDYNYDDRNVFPGANEFRWFDIRTIKHAVDNVARIDRDSALYHIHLMHDQRRPYNVYVNQNDLNGKRLIATYDGSDYYTQADYVWVYFTLNYPAPFVDGNVYVAGELADWDFGRKNLMRYDPLQKAYTLRMLLKQGFYNYQYVLLPNNAKAADASLIEGSHFETENDYFILAYYRQPGSLYDELIGFLNINSSKK
jgi:hypothetical protein